MKNKLISVVVPAYNEEEGIVACIQSLKKQNYKGPVEIIIVDNKSTDNTAKLAKNEGVNVVFEPNPGVCFARQKGTECAKGEIIISTDADTIFPINWITNIVNAFSADSNIVAVGGPFILKNPPWWGHIYTGLIFETIEIIYKLTGRCGIFGSNTAFKKNAWTSYDTSMPQGGDEVLLLKQLRKKGKIIFLPNNSVVTSSRRLEKGFWHFIIFYVMDYFYCLITGKSLVPPRAIRMSKEKLKA